MSNLTHKQAQFIHKDLQDMQTDWYNYQVEPESKPKTVFKNKVSQQEVQVLVIPKSEAEKELIGKLGEELKALNPNSPWIQQARNAYFTSNFFDLKQMLNNAIKIEKSTKLCFYALAKINA